MMHWDTGTGNSINQSYHISHQHKPIISHISSALSRASCPCQQERRLWVRDCGYTCDFCLALSRWQRNGFNFITLPARLKWQHVQWNFWAHASSYPGLKAHINQSSPQPSFSLALLSISKLHLTFLRENLDSIFLAKCLYCELFSCFVF